MMTGESRPFFATEKTSCTEVFFYGHSTQETGAAFRGQASQSVRLACFYSTHQPFLWRKTMIGTRIVKPVENYEKYTEAALWCNANKAMIEDRGDWYEVVALPEQTLEEARAAKLAEINGACDTVLKTAVKSYPDTEVMTFDQQVREAQAWLADPASPVSLLASLASARGIELADLARRVMAKHQSYSVLSGAVIGQRQALEDQLDACNSIEEVNALAVNIVMPS